MMPQHKLPTPPHSATLQTALAVVEAALLPYAASEASAVKKAQIEGRLTGGPITPFHSVDVPSIDLSAYAAHVARRTGYGGLGIAAGIALMARYACLSGRGLTPLAMHRLLATGMQLGMKAISDSFVKNVYVAPIAGMTLPELNHLEETLVDGVDFRCIPTNREVCELPRALAALGRQGRATRSAVMAVVHQYAFAPDILEQPVPPADVRAARKACAAAETQQDDEPLALPTVLLGLSSEERHADSITAMPSGSSSTSPRRLTRLDSSDEEATREHGFSGSVSAEVGAIRA